ncbi:MAG: hypothetical protein C4547_10520 [Phycisphaerales bacterium]|nr:MAG: hypothetical protein C4547_10520 [Phycisphaerales bacterium]
MRVRRTYGRLYGAASVALLVWCIWDVMPTRVTGLSSQPSTSCPLTIVSSDPPDGFADVLHVLDTAGQPAGVTLIHVEFAEPVDMTPTDVTVLSTKPPPQVAAVWGAGVDWYVSLDAPPQPGSSTAVVFCGGGVSVLFHSRPGDINLDGTADERDAGALEAAISSGQSEPALHDFNRDGAVNAGDVDTWRAVLEAGGFDLNGYDVTPNRVLCCCSGGYCSMHIGTACADGGTEAACPCTPNPCSGNGNSS